MAEVKNYGLSGVHRTLQLGKQGPVLVGNADTDSFSVTLQDGATLTNMGGANATSGTHFITKSQLDSVYTEAQFLANVNYNDSSPILLGNISSGTKTIITTFTVSTAFDANAVVTIGDSGNNSLLMSDNYCEIEATGVYQTINTVEFASNTSLNIYVTQGGASAGIGNVLVSVVDGPVVNAGAINYGAGGGGGGIDLTDLSVTTNSPSGNGSLSYNNTTGVFTFTPANASAAGGAGGDPAYKGFKASYGRMWGNNDDPNGPINKIVIYKETATPSSTIDASTNNDDFEVSGLSGSDVVAMIVAIGENVDQTTTAELKTFAEAIIDNVILDGGVEGQVNTAADMKTAFYDNFATFSATLTDLKAGLEFFSVNNQFNLSPQFSTGKGATFSGISYDMATDTLGLGSWGQNVGTHQVGDVFVIPGDTIQDANGNFLLTPANDVTVTITVAPDGYIGTATVTGTLPRPAEVWPSNSISDGGDDEYDTGNYISTNLDNQFSYNSGNVVSGSSAFGGGDYVVTYQDSIFGVFAVNADISSISTSGGSGFDGAGQADTGSLYGAANEAGVDIGDFVFTGSTITATTTGGDLYIKAGDDLWLDALDDDIHMRANDDFRIKTGFDFQNDSAQSEWIFTNNGSINFPDGSSQSTAWTGSVDYNNINNTPSVPSSLTDLISYGSNNNLQFLRYNSTAGQIEFSSDFRVVPFSDVAYPNGTLDQDKAGDVAFDQDAIYYCYQQPNAYSISYAGSTGWVPEGWLRINSIGPNNKIPQVGNKLTDGTTTSTIASIEAPWQDHGGGSTFMLINISPAVSSWKNGSGNLTVYTGLAPVTQCWTKFSKYDNSNVATLLGSFGSNSISTSGNISAGNVITTGKFVSGGNISLVAGAFTATFDNTGILTLPAMGGDEGGEINFGVPASNTTLSTRVVLDVYQDRLRIFDGNTKGAYIDLSQAATGVGTLLNNRVSGLVNAGTFVTMDNLKATVTTSGQRGLSLASVSGSFAYNIGGTFAGSGVGSGGYSGTGTLTTTATDSMFGWGFTIQGDTATYILTDTTNSRAYRITLQIGNAYNNNMISIERLI